MLKNIEIIEPKNIEKRSFEIITEMLLGRVIKEEHEPIIKRVIHTTADFDYIDTLKISENAVDTAIQAIKAGCNIVTDTKMAATGINKKVIERFGGEIISYMQDEDVAFKAKERGVTRASICMEKAIGNEKNKIFAIGNAPTALIRLYELIKDGKISPSLIIGVPVGFVNVVESKELIKELEIPYIISEGRKGGSNIAAAIVNAILYMMDPQRGVTNG